MNNPYKKLLNKLYAIQLQTLSKIEDIPDEKFIIPEEEGKWSLAQVLNHLYMSQWGTLQYMNKKLQAEKLPRANLSNWIRARLLHISLGLPTKFKAPGVLPPPENKGDMAGFTQKYQDLSLESESFFTDQTNRLKGQAIFKHPLAGRMNMKDTIRFWIWHWNHHMKQVDRIKEKVG